jgi:hypothetical protein
VELGSPYWQVGLGYALIGTGGRPVWHTGLAITHRLGPAARVGLASGIADLQRDLGGAIMQSIFGAPADRRLHRRGRHGVHRVMEGVGRAAPSRRQNSSRRRCGCH